VVQQELRSPTEGIMPNSTTPKLSDTQLVILSSASQRDDGLAVLPEKLKGGAAQAAVTKLLGLGFLKEVRVKRGEPAWRADDEEKPVGLKITKAGSAAIGVEDDTRGDERHPEPKSRRKPMAPAPRESPALALSRPTSSASCSARTGRHSTTWSRRPAGCRIPRARLSPVFAKKRQREDKRTGEPAAKPRRGRPAPAAPA
jgi:hypothetical protein